LLNRNKVLKNIAQNKSEITEIKFWDKEFVKHCVEVYKYREILLTFLIEKTPNLEKSFN
jgi:recombinational DNA repair ATPase RecF